ncbi:MAG: Ppx/GppA family phosphatase [Rhodobacter sp.]|nr:Ppx/GppA family phosphatase [Paracoccaceae bacterium]MCC0076975.1 Ppx/GppA family phosphatase [Rhodobacter sp.]
MTPERPAGAAAQPNPSRPPRRGRTPSGQEPKRQTRPEGAGLYAALDLGTNSCRMLIARPKGTQFEVIDSFSRAVELGTGLEATGRLGFGPMARTVQALRICRRKLDDHNVGRMRLVATEACRRARNSAEFIRKIQRETGLRLEIIPAEEEARLAVISCAPLVSAQTEQLLVIDIGGGSTELVWIDLAEVPPDQRRAAILTVKLGLDAPSAVPHRPGQPRVIDWISVPLGVATLREQFTDVEDDAARFALMSWHFEEQLHNFSPYQNPAPREGFQIIGTSGTVTTVAASYLGLKRYDRNKVDGLTMTSAQIDQVIRDYLALGPEGRRTDPRIGRERHGLIMSGAAILQALMRVWPTDVMSVADRGLREGLLYAQMSHDGVLQGL